MMEGTEEEGDGTVETKHERREAQTNEKRR